MASPTSSRASSRARPTRRTEPAASAHTAPTGDELARDDEALAAGKIRDANGPALAAAVREAGCDSVELGCVRDDMGALIEVLASAPSRCDAVVVSGGVSVGDHDYTYGALRELGDAHSVQLAIKPGKPFVYGAIGELPVLALPGNPLSALVSFELFVRPGLRRLGGHRNLERALLVGRADLRFVESQTGSCTSCGRAPPPARAENCGYPLEGQGSHQLHAMAASDVLAVLADGPGAPEGSPVRALLLSGSGPAVTEQLYRSRPFLSHEYCRCASSRGGPSLAASAAR